MNEEGVLYADRSASSSSAALDRYDTRILERLGAVFSNLWSRFPDVWVHGDWAAVDEDGLWYILGRSDDTIKIAGKRLGPAEVESVLVSHPAVSEAAAIGVPDPLKGEALICFCVLKPGSKVVETLREELRARVAEQLGKPLKPEVLKFLDDLPKTRNAKIIAALFGRATWTRIREISLLWKIRRAWKRCAMQSRRTQPAPGEEAHPLTGREALKANRKNQNKPLITMSGIEEWN